jgi:uncharacterized membrane protein YjjP (DUF1212 family)/uncharacterized membrane protein YjjB (DUF3815 family)
VADPDGAEPPARVRRRSVRLALRLGVVMLASGAQAKEVEASLRELMAGLRLDGGDAIVTNSSVTISYVPPGDADALTAVEPVRDWRPEFGRLAAVADLVSGVRDGRLDLAAAEACLDRIVEQQPRYPPGLRFAAPALLAAAVTILFGGDVGDALAALGIGLAVQPVLTQIDRLDLPPFFQVVAGVAASVALVVLLVGIGLPIDGGLVLTGSLLRFLPGAQLVAGMRDLIARATVPGAANLAEVLLLGAAIATAASFVLALGERLLGVQLALVGEGRADWPALVTIGAGAAAVAAYCVRLSVPGRLIAQAALLGGLAVVVGNGLSPGLAGLDRDLRTLVAALAIGSIGGLLASRHAMPAALWVVPAILPLLPAPATLLPLLAPPELQGTLEGQALATAFFIGVGVASGDILVATYRRLRAPRTRVFTS